MLIRSENLLGNMNSEGSYPDKLVVCRLAVQHDTIRSFAEMSGDFNPIHIDIDAAKRSGMSTVIAHGSIALNLLWESIERSFGSASMPNFELDVRFRAPIYLDESVESGGSRIENTNKYDVWILNQKGERVIDGTLRVTNLSE